MEKEFNNLRQDSLELDKEELENEISDFVNDFINRYNNSSVISISLIEHSSPESYDGNYCPKGWSGKSSLDEYFFGKDLSGIIEKGISKKVFYNDEDLGRFWEPELREFKYEIQNELFKYLSNLKK